MGARPLRAARTRALAAFRAAAPPGSSLWRRVAPPAIRGSPMPDLARETCIRRIMVGFAGICGEYGGVPVSRYMGAMAPIRLGGSWGFQRRKAPTNARPVGISPRIRQNASPSGSDAINSARKNAPALMFRRLSKPPRRHNAPYFRIIQACGAPRFLLPK